MAETWVLIVKSWRKNVKVGLTLKCRNFYSIMSFEGPALSRAQEKGSFLTSVAISGVLRAWVGFPRWCWW